MEQPGTAGRTEPPEGTVLCLPCLVCGKVLKPLHPGTAAEQWRANPKPPRAQPAQATVLRGQPGHGSEFDLSEPIEVNVCDECLTAAGEQGQVNLVIEKQLVQTSRYRWLPR